MSRLAYWAKAMAAIATAGLAGAAPVRAQTADTWPSRPITIIVPASAGSGMDKMAREMASRLSLALKQSVVVDNKPGGSGVIGTSAVVRAAPDGYTLLYTNASFAVVAPAVVKGLPYDVKRDLVPIAQTTLGGVLLLVNKDFPAKNLQELVRYVKAHPDTISYGSWAPGSTGNLIMEWLKKQTGMQTAHVPYRQVTQLLTELSTGVLQIGWTDSVAPLPFLESGKIRGIAISGDVRGPRTPNVPTMGEQGYPFSSVGWYGVFAPRGTPPAIAERLTAEINKIQSLPETAAKMKSINLAPPPVKTSAQFGTIVANDLQVWKEIVTDTGITVDN